jgi:hypothetical protein
MRRQRYGPVRRRSHGAAQEKVHQGTSEVEERSRRRWWPHFGSSPQSRQVHPPQGPGPRPGPFPVSRQSRRCGVFRFVREATGSRSALTSTPRPRRVHAVEKPVDDVGGDLEPTWQRNEAAADPAQGLPRRARSNRPRRPDVRGDRSTPLPADARLHAGGAARPRRHAAAARDTVVAGIAAELVVSERTVGHHLAHVNDKTGRRTPAGAAVFAMEHGLVPGEVERPMWPLGSARAFPRPVTE